jgi:hypothetical protein
MSRMSEMTSSSATGCSSSTWPGRIGFCAACRTFGIYLLELLPLEADDRAHGLEILRPRERRERVRGAVGRWSLSPFRHTATAAGSRARS